MTAPTPAYRAYLLRLWRTADGQWRASLEEAQTGVRLGFATLGQLAEFIAHETEGSRPPARPDLRPPAGDEPEG